MDGAIWGILYDLGEEHRSGYLNWFHDIHIPEKLARPGYFAAGHYGVVSPDGQPASVMGGETADGVAGFIALFFGEDTSVFLNPSPAQIKPKQTELTRTMMGYRLHSRSFIATREWGIMAMGSNTPPQSRQDAAIGLSLFDTPGLDEDLGAWCVQDLKPSLASHTEFRSLSKHVSTVGLAKHVLLSTFASPGAAHNAHDQAGMTEWAKRISSAQSHIPGSPLVARRIWPAAQD